MLRLNNYPIARALSSARSSARVSSLPHSHRRPCTPPLGSPVLVRGGPASLGTRPTKRRAPKAGGSAPTPKKVVPPQKNFALLPPLYPLVALAYPSRKRNVNLALLEVA